MVTTALFIPIAIYRYLVNAIFSTDIGDLYSWGWNERGQLGLPSKVVREQQKVLAQQQPSQQTQDVTERQDAPNQCLQSSRSCEAQSKKQELSQYSSEVVELVNIQTLPAVMDLLENGENVDIVDVSAGSRHTAAISGEIIVVTKYQLVTSKKYFTLYVLQEKHSLACLNFQLTSNLTLCLLFLCRKRHTVYVGLE